MEEQLVQGSLSVMAVAIIILIVIPTADGPVGISSFFVMVSVPGSVKQGGLVDTHLDSQVNNSIVTSHDVTYNLHQTTAW